MNCDRFLESLDDWLDGDLPADDVHVLERHAADCESCANELAGARRLRRLAAELPRERRPARDLWPGIAARLETGIETGSVASARQPWLRALAAGIALVAVFFAGMMADRVMQDSAGPAGTRMVRQQGASDQLPGVQEARRVLPASHVELIEGDGGLASGVGMDRATEQELLRNLLVVNLAIREVESAASNDPANANLRELLGNLYAQEQRILGQAERLRVARQIPTRTGI